MPRVIGIDPGTVSIDLCGLDDGRVFLDESYPTREALADPARFVAHLESCAPLDLIAGPSGYGLPLRHARELTETDIGLAYLAAPGDAGGIGGLRSLARTLARSGLPMVFTPGVIHLPTVPRHRKVNRVDMGTADKVCATALAVRGHVQRHGCALEDVSLILLELGGGFSAAIAVHGGRIVDGVGGSSGPIGMQAPGALDGEVAYLAGTITKAFLFSGGAANVAGDANIDAESFAAAATPAGAVAWDAYIEGAVKAIAAMLVSAPDARDIVLSGRMARVPRVCADLQRRIAMVSGGLTIRVLHGSATTAKQGAEGAALVADGLAGGAEAELVRRLGIMGASGTALDYLTVISPRMARRRLGLPDA